MTADVAEVAELRHGEDNVVCADAGYIGVEIHLEHEGRDVIRQIAARYHALNIPDN
jgi:IS5 family transposase